MTTAPLRVGTRGSALAVAQAEGVARSLRELGERADLVRVATAGDRDAAAGDKGRWVGALEQALAAGEIDLAVHSAKDVPGELGDGLAILAVPAREDPRDALCGCASLDALAPGARVGTSSVRRRAQLLSARQDLAVVQLRGNVDTRLGRLASGEADALVLALAGLRRLGREREAGGTLEGAGFVPAPGQGALVVQGRSGDARADAAAAPLQDRESALALAAERALVRALEASCLTPVGAHAALAGNVMRLRAFVGLPDGSAWLRDELTAEVADAQEAEALGTAAGGRLLAAGAGDLLARAERGA